MSSKIIYLYVKQHSITGLKYFGKTITNPFKYSGSGKYWKSHIKKNGTQHIKTIDVYGFDDQELCTEFAINFSIENNIIESEEWANLVIEDARQNYAEPYKEPKQLTMFKYFRYTNTGNKHTSAQKNKWSNDRKGEGNSFYNKNHNDETKKKIGTKNSTYKRTDEQVEILQTYWTDKKRSIENRNKLSKYSKTRFWIVNKKGDTKHCIDLQDQRLLSGEYKLGKKWKD